MLYNSSLFRWVLRHSTLSACRISPSKFYHTTLWHVHREKFSVQFSSLLCASCSCSFLVYHGCCLWFPFFTKVLFVVIYNPAILVFFDLFLSLWCFFILKDGWFKILILCKGYSLYRYKCRKEYWCYSSKDIEDLWIFRSLLKRISDWWRN